MPSSGFKFGDFHSYKNDDKLGEGAYGKVYRVTRKSGKKEFAVKVLESKSEGDKKKFLNEIDMLKKVSDRRVVEFHDHDEMKDKVYIFMRYMEKGSVFDMIKKQNSPFSEAETQRYTQHIIQGLKFLHDNKILHRDIKGKNVLVDANNNAALSDFGLSTEVLGSMTSKHSTCGTLYYMSPETLNADKSGRRADIWSAGCTVVEMLTKHPPWSQYKPKDAMEMISKEPNKPQITMDLPAGAKQFLCLIFVRKNKRSYVDDLLKHKWIN